MSYALMLNCRLRWILGGLVVIGAATLATNACRSDHGPAPDASLPPSVSATPASTSPPASARSRLVVLGDSLTAGLGIMPEEAYPALLQARLDQHGYHYEVVNAGVSGDTTAGGLRRLDWALEGDVQLLIVALGGNDGLRGLPVGQMTQNLGEIIERAQRRDIAVLLAGMEAPPNLGWSYTVTFRKAFRTLAAHYEVRLVPFLLEGVGGVSAFNQADGIHPNPAGARIVADNIWRVLEPMLHAPPR